MTLPNLAGLRLASTEEYVRFRKADVPENDSDLCECPVLKEDFREGDWVWRTTRAEGRKNYNPATYWGVLKATKGRDPLTMTRVARDHVAELARGPPDPRRQRELASPAVVAAEQRRWDAAAAAAAQPGGVPQWLLELLSDDGISRQRLAAVVELGNEDDHADLIWRLGIDDTLIAHADQVALRRNLRMSAAATAVDRAVHWHMPFVYLDESLEGLEDAEVGVRYEWLRRRERGEFFRIYMALDPNSAMKGLLDEMRLDPGRRDPHGLETNLRPVVLRALVGEDSPLDIAALGRAISETFLYSSYLSNPNDRGSLGVLSICIRVELMAWLCTDSRGQRPVLPTHLVDRDLEGEGGRYSPWPTPPEWSLDWATAPTAVLPEEARRARACWLLALRRMINVARALPAYLYRNIVTSDAREQGVYVPPSPLLQERAGPEWVVPSEDGTRMVYNEPLWYAQGLPENES